MATITTFVSGTQAHQDLMGRAVGAYNTIDFSATSVSAADVVQALKIPANSLVTDVYVIVRTAEGATCTATVGDGDGTNSWDASTNLNATAGTVTSGAEGTDTYAVGKFYSSADTIDLTMGHDTDAAKVTVIAFYTTIDA